MHPILWHIGPVTIHWFGVMMALAFLAGLANWTWLGRRDHRSFSFCSDLLFWIMVSGILGARLAYVVANWRTFAEAPWSALFIHQGGLIFYGGLLGALAAVVMFSRQRGLPLLALLDFIATSTPLAHALGRIGCFLNGCCHGRICGVPPGVHYPAQSPPWWHHYQAGLIRADEGRSLPVHPLQLYEAAFNLLFYLLLVGMYRRRKTDGWVFATYLVGYPIARFCFEFLRGDPRTPCGPITWAQALSLMLLAVGVTTWAVLHRRDRGATRKSSA